MTPVSAVCGSRYNPNEKVVVEFRPNPNSGGGADITVSDVVIVTVQERE